MSRDNRVTKAPATIFAREERKELLSCPLTIGSLSSLNTQLLNWTRSHSMDVQSNADFPDMTLSWDIQLALGLAGFRNDVTD